MPEAKRIVIVAGEESGDLHAAALVQQLLARDKSLVITGIGGQHLQNAGVNLISQLACFGITGLSGVVRYARIILQAFKDIKAHLYKTKPDLLILVDYPGFNLRLAKFAKQKLGLQILYYISPQIWAWKAGRIKAIRAYVDRMAVILPFEKAIYQQAAVPVSFVGHPLTEKIFPGENPLEARKKLNLPIDKLLIAMLPGSRSGEIKNHLPVLVDTALKLSKQHCDLHFVIPIAGTLEPQFVKSYFIKHQIPISFVSGKALEVMACSDCNIVASGTASLECALLGKPMCIIYKSAWLTYLIASQVIKINYLGLCNILANKMIVPELLQYDCNAKELAQVVTRLLKDEPAKKAVMNNLQELKISLSSSQADCPIDTLVQTELASC